MNPFQFLLLLGLAPFVIAVHQHNMSDNMDNTLSNSEHDRTAEPVIDGNAQQSQAQADEHDDNAPMVYYTPKDYRASALEQRPILEAEGNEVVLQSEVASHVGVKRPDESPADYAQRYSETMNDMIRRGVLILNDQCTGDQAPDMFSVGGHNFDVGPKSGATKKEYREFGEWFDSVAAEEGELESVPEKFRKFEVERTGADEEDA